VRAPTAALDELRRVVGALRDEQDTSPAGPVLVNGMLAEQLARLLADGAAPGAVIAADPLRLSESSVLVHILAGDPSAEDEDLVRSAGVEGVPTVLVQLWPQAEWSTPFVLTPFVVECRAGEGFPVPEIAARIIEAAERPAALARRIPVLEARVARRIVAAAALRAGLLGGLGTRSKPARPLITMEQVRMLGELSSLDDKASRADSLPVHAGLATSVIGVGLAFRWAARSVRQALPAPLANALIAAGGTWALGEAFRRYGDRLP
jgi:hypothetical protein